MKYVKLDFGPFKSPNKAGKAFTSFAAPPDFKCVAQREKLNFMSPLKAGESRGSRVERLFTHAPKKKVKSTCSSVALTRAHENLLNLCVVYMAYLGGKARCADHILKVLNDPKYDNMSYLEPFVGYAHILRRIKNKKSYMASDNNALLMALLIAVQKGKHRPFPMISKEQWLQYKHDNRISLQRAIAGFAYSYRGDEFSGYAGDEKYGRNYPQERVKYYDSLHDNSVFQKTALKFIDYRKLNPKGKLIYCDPPYRNSAKSVSYVTNKYGSSVKFDSDEFWNVMRKWSKDNKVFVSEYVAPPDFKCVAQMEKPNLLGPRTEGTCAKRIEKLFTRA